MTYTVSEIEVPGAGVFYSARKDSRTAKEIVNAGINGRQAGSKSPVYQALDEHRTCIVTEQYSGLTKQEAIEKRRELVFSSKGAGRKVLNVTK